MVVDVLESSESAPRSTSHVVLQILSNVLLVLLRVVLRLLNVQRYIRCCQYTHGLFFKQLLIIHVLNYGSQLFCRVSEVDLIQVPLAGSFDN